MLCRVAAAVLLISIPPANARVCAPVRGSQGFTGLERLLHFERVEEPALLPAIGPWLRTLLPDLLPPASHSLQPQTYRFEEGDDGKELVFVLQDFILPPPLREDTVVRQVLDLRRPRVPEQFWALYEGGARVDCWFFSPFPLSRGPVTKILAPYVIREIDRTGDGDLVFHTWGSMHRPGGFGWIQEKDFFFSDSEGELRFKYVVGPFYLSYRDKGSPGVIVERVTQEDNFRTIEIRSLDSIPQEVLKECGHSGAFVNDRGEPLHLRQLERISECLVRRPGARLRFRKVDQPSFVEHQSR